LQGRAQYDAAEIKKRAARVAFLSEFTQEVFPEVSNTGLPNTKAKTDIWDKRADFDKRLSEFVQNAQAFAQVAAKESTASDAFKASAGALGQTCKGCHDNFREK
jgi:cytochrome c556